MYYFQKIFFTILFFQLIVSSIYGQRDNSATIKTDTLRSVEITADKNSNSLRSITPQQQISSKQIFNIGLLQTSDAVKYFSGVNVKDYGGIGGLKTISVRGFSANQTAVSYDGIRVSNMQTGQIDLSQISLENVQNISLFNGQNEDIFQPANLFASSSILAIKTKVPEFKNGKNYNTKIGFKVGSFGYVNPSFNFSQKINKTLSFTTNGEFLYSNGKYPFKLPISAEGIDTTKYRKNSDVTTYKIEATLFSKFSDKNSGYLKVSYYDSDRGLPGSIKDYNNTKSGENLKSKDFFTQAHFCSKINEKFEYQLSAKYAKDYTHYSDTIFPNDSGKISNKYIQQEIYGTTSIQYKPNHHFAFSLSSDLSLNILDSDLSDFAFPERINWLTAFAGKYINNWISISSSLLYTQTNDKVKVGTAFENQQKLSPYTGFSVKPFQNVNLRFRAFYKNIFQLPTFNDLYYTYFGSRNLKPENTNQFNIGTTYLTSYKNLDFLSITADVYHNNVTNKIVAKPGANLFYWSMINYGKVSINGSDINISGKINFSDKTHITITNAFTYMLALDKTDPNNGTYNNKLPYLPQFSGASSVVLDLNYFLFSYTIVWSGERYSGYENTETNKLSGYADQSVSIAKNIKIKKREYNLGLQLLNITNNNYEVVKNYPMPGRNFRINLSINI